jgi:signal transduction histidine kinase
MIALQIAEQDPVLVLAPTLGDAALSSEILRGAGIPARVFTEVEALSEDLAAGAGALLLTEQVLSKADVQTLVDKLRRQPSWSDIPVLLLSESGADSSAAPRALELFGNVTVLERPVRLTTLVSALRAALRARARQYELRDQLLELRLAEASLRKQSSRLRLLWEAASVLLTTEEPDVMMRALFAKIAPHFGLDTYFNFMVGEGSEGLRLESCVGVSAAEARRIATLGGGETLSGNVALLRRPIIATHIQQSNDPMVQTFKEYGLRVFACNPLLVEGRLLGTLAFASRRRDQFDGDEVEFLQTISQYVTVAYERLRLIRQLRDTDRRKDEFLATLAHELRNPLAPIRNALEVLSLTGDDDDAAGRETRALMERQLGQMVRLIDDLLDVSRITRGKLELRKERVELATVINNAVDTARPLIESRGHQLFLALPAQPVHLEGDPMRLAQVFSNLLNNAAKYTERGGSIWLTAAARDGMATVSVRDTGVGIPAEALPYIFEMFMQVDRSLEKSQGGLGIGLTLVKLLVELHGGVVEARSAGVGAGTAFSVRLPVSEAPPLPANPPRLAASSSTCRVLVADDNRDAAESMGIMLRLMGNEVRLAYDGEEAVEEAARFHPDLVLLDIGMPRLNGYEAARRIRAEAASPVPRLVALTGWGQDEDKRRASEAGFDEHFTKPVDPEDLVRIVARAAQ